jgi:uncharacterized protein (TIGR02611 family)
MLAMWIETLRQARRIVIAVVGFTMVVIGAAMIVAPGPGWLVILFGLSILAAEFVWARRLLRRLKRTGVEIGRALLSAASARGDDTAARTGSEPKPDVLSDARAPQNEPH